MNKAKIAVALTAVSSLAAAFGFSAITTPDQQDKLINAILAVIGLFI